MRVVVECTAFDKGGEVSGKGLQFKAANKAGEMIGVRSDVANRPATTVFLRVSPPGCLGVSLAFDRSCHPFERILNLHGSYFAELSSCNHMARLVDHGVSRIGIGNTHEATT